MLIYKKNFSSLCLAFACLDRTKTHFAFRFLVAESYTSQTPGKTAEWKKIA